MNDIREKIFNYILTMVVEKKMSPSDKIPTENELAKKFSTNRMNAHFAIKMLEKEGIVKRTKRVGTFIHDPLPSELVLNLQSMSTKNVHVLASSSKSTNIHWNNHTIEEIEKILTENNYILIHNELPEKPKREDFKAIIGEICKDGSRALAILPDRGETFFILEHLDILMQYPGEIYLLNRGVGELDKWPFHSICMDPFGEGIIVGKYLGEKNHHNIVFFEDDTPVQKHSHDRRRQGLELGLKYSTKNKVKLDIWRFPRNTMVKDCFKRIMNSKIKLTVVAQRDSFAAELIEEAKKYAFSVPDNFMLVSFDNNPDFRKFNLTTVAPPLERIGKLFGECICSMNGYKNEGDKLSLKVESRLLERNSCN